MSSDKKCLECGDKITGRIDKKFCSDQCRIAYNNRLNSDNTNLVRNINNALRKNRRILMELNTTGKSKTTREKLLEKGFDFQYFTSIYTTKEGAVYHYCYEQGYLQTDKDWFLLVVRQEKNKLLHHLSLPKKLSVFVKIIFHFNGVVNCSLYQIGLPKGLQRKFHQ